MATPRATAAVAPLRRADALVRVSTEKDGGTSPELQEASIRGYADTHGIQIANWVYGIDESGSRRKSAWWAKLDASIERLEAGLIDVIVVWRFSRTARNRLKWAIALDRVDTAGGAILSSTEPVDADTASGKLHRGMMGEFNAYYADMMSESWKETHARRRRAGLPSGGGPRFGYELKDGQYTLHPVESPILAEMYRRAAAGEGFASIARWLNQAGHTTRAGREWSRATVTALLDTGFGAGKIIQRPTRGEWRDFNPLHATYHPGAHEPLVDEAAWDAYLARRATTPDRRRPAHGGYMLSGLVKCGEEGCGAPMHVGANQRTDYYRCSRATSTGIGRKLSMTRALVEQGVYEWLLLYAAALDKEVAAAAKEKPLPTPKPVNDIAALDTLLKRNSERAAKLTIRNLDGDMPDHVYRATLDELDRERRSLQERRDQAAAPPPQRPQAADVRAFLDTWDTTPPGEQNAAIRALIDRVIIHPPPRQGTGVWRRRIEVAPAFTDKPSERRAIAEAARNLIRGPW